jgi:predicted RNA-binding protein (TIGR00451 family)
MMPRLRVDKGAIRFVFAGANIMCPGLTSKGATMHDEVDEDTPVVRRGAQGMAPRSDVSARLRRTVPP